MAHSPHANILKQARLSLAPGHVARRAYAYLIALVSCSAAMMTWENHASAISPTPLAGTVAPDALRTAHLPRRIATPFEPHPLSKRDDDDLHSQYPP